MNKCCEEPPLEGAPLEPALLLPPRLLVEAVVLLPPSPPIRGGGGGGGNWITGPDEIVPVNKIVHV